MNNSVLISRNIQLSYKLTAKEIHITSSGEVILFTKHFGPKILIPNLTIDYLEALCSKFYFGGYTHQNAIADIMLLNGLLSTNNYGDFYDALRNNLAKQRVTIISSDLF